MRKYKELKEFTEKQFRRLTGAQRDTFEVMVAILLEAQGKRYRKAGIHYYEIECNYKGIY